MSRFVVSLALGLSAALLAGCGDKKPTPTSEFKNEKDGHDHGAHEGNEQDATMPDGKVCHAVLGAHFSADHGNELEVHFETTDKEPKPVTLSEKTKLTARVTRAGDDKAYDLEFKPVEKKERATDPEGQCSRFAAEVPWMRSTDKLTVTLTIEGVTKKVNPWIDFEPGKYVHKD